MLLQESAIIVDCPVCGRPAQVRPDYTEQELACGHCRGQFVVHDSGDGLAAVKKESNISFDHESRLSPMETESSSLCNRGDDDTHECPCRQTAVSLDQTVEPHRVAFVVEHRDEVFARIATDIAEAGYRVIRAMCGTDALKSCGRYKPTLVVANIELPDQNGWRLAFKLAMVDPNLRVWLYSAQLPSYDAIMANLLSAEMPIEYRGDLLSLSEAIVERLAAQETFCLDSTIALQSSWTECCYSFAWKARFASPRGADSTET